MRSLSFRTPDMDMNQNWKTPRRKVRSRSAVQLLETISGDEDDNLEEDFGENETETKSSCRFCKQKITRVYRLRKHEKTCEFQVPRNLITSGVKVSKVKLIENCETLASKLKLLSIEDSYEYNSIALLCVPGVYPLVFTGKSHFGNKSPPILKKTGYNQSFNILVKLLHLHGEVTLNNHIILVEENHDTEIYLGPHLLIPDSPKIVIKFSDENITKLSLKPEDKSEESISEGSDFADEEVVDLSVTVNAFEDQPPMSIPVLDLDDDDLLRSDGRYSEDVLNCCAHMFSNNPLMPADVNDTFEDVEHQADRSVEPTDGLDESAQNVRHDIIDDRDETLGHVRPPLLDLLNTPSLPQSDFPQQPPSGFSTISFSFNLTPTFKDSDNTSGSNLTTPARLSPTNSARPFLTIRSYSST